MPPVVAVMAVIAVAQIALSIKQGQDTKKAAKKDADARQRRLEITRQQRALERQRREAQLRREARGKSASIVNSSFAQGVRFSTSFAGASSAIAANQQREQTFLSQSAALASSADDITSEQININKNRIIDNATNEQIGGTLEGIGTFASAFAGGPGGAG